LLGAGLKPALCFWAQSARGGCSYHSVTRRLLRRPSMEGLLAKTYGRARGTVPLLVVAGVTTLQRERQATHGAWIPASLIRSGTGLGRNGIQRARQPRPYGMLCRYDGLGDRRGRLSYRLWLDFYYRAVREPSLHSLESARGGLQATQIHHKTCAPRSCLRVCPGLVWTCSSYGIIWLIITDLANHRCVCPPFI